MPDHNDEDPLAQHRQRVHPVTDSSHPELSRLRRGAVSLQMPVLVAVSVFLMALSVLAVSAEACGGGSPPSEPTPKEKGGGEKGSSKLEEWEACAGKPVNCATGFESEGETDVSVGGRGPGLAVTRSYSSLVAVEATEAGAWGFGWSGPYSAHLTLNAEAGTATVTEDSGSVVVFYKSGETYSAGSWIEATFAKSGSNYVYTLPDQSKLEFNSEGQLTKETDRNGNSNTLAYNGENRLETVTDGDSRKLTFAYNGSHEVESIKDPLGHVVKYAYESGDLKKVTIEGKVRWEFTYESHLLTKVKDGREHTVTNEYDASHRVIKQTIAGHERKFTYSTPPGTETNLIEPNGSETLEQFNAAGEATKITRAKGVSGVEATWEYEYNSAFQLIKLIDPNKHVTEYGYDSEDNKTSEVDPNKDERKWKYNSKHDIESETTPEGETTTIKRNGNGDPETIERPDGGETQATVYKYDAEGDTTETVDPLKHTTKYTYDSAGDREIAEDPEGGERKWKYNEDSQVTEETDPRGLVTKTERDEQGRPTKITDPLSHVTEYTYDGNGNIEAEVDGNKQTTKYVYNEENLPTKVEEPNGDHPETGYDSEGKMTSHTDGNGHIWEYKRNQLEQITEEKNPLGKITKKKYDKAGVLESQEDPEKHVTTLKYDESNRLKESSYSTGSPSTVKLEYNKDSRVTKMTDGTGTTKNTYDKLDRLTEAENGASKLVKYEYNLKSQPTKITYPNTKSITRSYDKNGRIEKVVDWNSKTTKFSYNADSQLEKTVFPSGTEDEDVYSYNNADQMTEVKMAKSTSKLGALSYERDGSGQVTKTVTTVLPGAGSSKTVYDESNRLTEGQGRAYEYDKANNPTKIEGTAGYAYNNADELEKGAGNTYAYSEGGRRTEAKPETGSATTYGYDQAGNLTSVERASPTIKDSYTYDGASLRQTQTINGTKTNLTWDTAEQLPLLLEDETNNYIYGPEGLPIEQISTGGTTLYLHHDQQGSTRLLTNTSGNTEAAYTYTPYGSLNASSGTASTPLRYDAQYTNTDTELIYLRARAYDPRTAQFLSVDPALEETGEPYAYAGDDPENGTDLTGECQPPGECAALWRLLLEDEASAARLERLAIANRGTAAAVRRGINWWNPLALAANAQEEYYADQLVRIAERAERNASGFRGAARDTARLLRERGCPQADYT